MVYYMVKDEMDGKHRKLANHKIEGEWISGELLTPAEIRKFYNWEQVVTKIITKKTNTYWCFGARFMDKDAEFTEEIL